MIKNDDLLTRESFDDSIIREIEILNKSKTNYINVVEHGIDNTGVEEISNKLQLLLDNAPVGSCLYFPSGVYLFEHGITINKMITLCGDSDTFYEDNLNEKTQSSTIFKLKDGVSDVTIITTGDNVRCKIKNIFLKSSSFKCVWAKQTYDTEKNMWIVNIPDGVKGLRYKEEVREKNVNGIIMNPKSSYYSELSNVYVEGFSGVGIKTGVYNFVNNVSSFNCHIGIEFGIDTQATLCRSQCCGYGFVVSGIATIMNNCRCDEIVYDGLVVKSGFLDCSGYFSDQTGHSAIRISEGYNINIVANINRCCTFFSGGDFKSTEDKYKGAFSMINIEGNVSRLNIKISGVDKCAVDDQSTYSTINHGILTISNNSVLDNIIFDSRVTLSSNTMYKKKQEYDEIFNYIYITKGSILGKFNIRTIEDNYYGQLINSKTNNNYYIKNNWLIEQTQYGADNHYLPSLKCGLFKVYNGNIYMSVSGGEEGAKGLWKKISSTDIEL